MEAGEIAFLTHYWIDERFPNQDTVTKVGCCDLDKLIQWGNQYGLNPEWIHLDPRYPHYDLLGNTQVTILKAEGYEEQLKRFNRL